MQEYMQNTERLAEALRKKQRRTADADMDLWQSEGAAALHRENARRANEGGLTKPSYSKFKLLKGLFGSGASGGSATSMPGMSAVGTYDALAPTTEFSMGGEAAAGDSVFTSGAAEGTAAEGAAAEGAAGAEGGSAAAGGSGEAAGYGGWVGAAILGQHLLSQGTDTTYEGNRTGDAFNGNYGTEPWLGYVADKFNAEPTAGEKWDAAMANGEDRTAIKRTPAMADYWANPGGGWLTTGGEGLGLSHDTSQLAFNPLGFFLGRL